MSRGGVGYLIAAVLLIASRERSFVSTAAIGPSDYNNDAVRSGLTNRVIDEDVRDLQSLKPSFSEGVQSVGIHKSQSAIFTDVNGQKESHIDNKEEVNSNGQKVGSFHLQAEAKELGNSPTPVTHIHSELDIPQRGIHRVYDTGSSSSSSGSDGTSNINTNFNNAAAPLKRKVLVPRTDVDENNVDGYRSFSGVQYSPFDMAEYVFWTGDEKGVTVAIEEFLQDGLMTREEAIAFLQEIKMNLDYLQTHYAEERLQKQEQAKERAKQLQKALSNMDKFTENKMGGLSELSEVRQQMRENLSKKAVDSDDTVAALSRARVPQTAMQQTNLGLTDEDYEDLLERLRVADFLYTEYSLEEVIYQLAKVMFSQSLTRGSNEAQEALQKFTGFLEAEAEQGRISRSLEKKVLDVLIASLTDTLTEHPELVNAARAGLGGDQMAMARTGGHTDRTLQQMLLLNQGPSSQTQTKTALDLGKNIMQTHRFQGGEAAALSEAGLPPMKKSSPSTNQQQHANNP